MYGIYANIGGILIVYGIYVILICVNYNDLTALPHWNHMVGKGNHPQMALIQVSEILFFAQIHGI